VRINKSNNKEEEIVDETKCRVRKLTKEEELKKVKFCKKNNLIIFLLLD
jgi:hypothetical protein